MVAAGDRFDEVYGVSTHAACRARPTVGLVVHFEGLPHTVARDIRPYRTETYPSRIDPSQASWAADHGRVIEDLYLFLNRV